MRKCLNLFNNHKCCWSKVLTKSSTYVHQIKPWVITTTNLCEIFAKPLSSCQTKSIEFLLTSIFAFCNTHHFHQVSLLRLARYPTHLPIHQKGHCKRGSSVTNEKHSPTANLDPGHLLSWMSQVQILHSQMMIKIKLTFQHKYSGTYWVHVLNHTPFVPKRVSLWSSCWSNS